MFENKDMSAAEETANGSKMEWLGAKQIMLETAWNTSCWQLYTNPWVLNEV